MNFYRSCKIFDIFIINVCAYGLWIILRSFNSFNVDRNITFLFRVYTFYHLDWAQLFSCEKSIFTSKLLCTKIGSKAWMNWHWNWLYNDWSVKCSVFNFYNIINNNSFMNRNLYWIETISNIVYWFQSSNINNSQKLTMAFISLKFYK